jgi:hypothetical protein
MVCKEDYSEKHPQIQVRPKTADKIYFPNARPDRSSQTTQTKLAANVAKHAFTITVDDAGNISRYDPIGIEMVLNTTVNTASNGTVVHWTVVNTITGVTIGLLTPMPELSLASAVVWTPGTLDGETILGTTEVLVTNL